MSNETSSSGGLVKEVICPNCWERFAPESTLYVSAHQDLFGDLRLGPQQQRRFLPTRFHTDGRALDSKGESCHELACPRCHLSVPRILMERPSFFASIFGSPSSGKSYLLAAMTHRLRTVLPKSFAVDFSDADPQANAILHGYEDTLFGGGGNPNALVHLRKTEEVGDWYQKVFYGTREIPYPRPFFFQISPVGGHPFEHNPAAVSRTLCIYDNAGESFQPGADRPDNPVTQHMAKSGCMMFVFDPTQEPEFRKLLATLSNDVQVRGHVTSRQEVLLAEAARRVKIYRGLPANTKHDKPLIVLVNKYDVWQKLLSNSTLPDPWEAHSSHRFSVLRTDYIEKVSATVCNVLRKYTPSIVSTAESFVDPKKIIYIPVSATGGSPELGSDGLLAHRACALKPMWVEVPLLYVLSQYGSMGQSGGGIIPYYSPKTKQRTVGTTPAAPATNGDAS